MIDVVVETIVERAQHLLRETEAIARSGEAIDAISDRLERMMASIERGGTASNG